MWFWECEWHALGFRRKSDCYWQCGRGYGLPTTAYLSAFIHTEQPVTETGEIALLLLEISTFHVTFLIRTERVHFYYHEFAENIWKPGGHTSSAEIRCLGANPRKLRGQADRIAQQLIEMLGGVLQPRRR